MTFRFITGLSAGAIVALAIFIPAIVILIIVAIIYLYRNPEVIRSASSPFSNVYARFDNTRERATEIAPSVIDPMEIARQIEERGDMQPTNGAAPVVVFNEFDDAWSH